MRELHNLLHTMLMLNLDGVRGANFKSFDKAYKTNLSAFPRVYANDGFSISIQVHCYSCSKSEKGYREFGMNIISAEWGFPSEEIDSSYNPEDPDNTRETVGSCSMDKLQSLIDEHGGIDYKTTFEKAHEGYCVKIKQEIETKSEDEKKKMIMTMMNIY